MKKIAALLGICICIVIFSGCNGKEESLEISSVKEETLLIRSDDTLQLGVDEAFDKVYYSENDLKDFINDAIEKYNDENGKNSVKLTAFKVEDEKAKAVFTYANVKSYNDMNGVNASLYTVKEAVAAGVLPESFTNAVDGKKATLDDVEENEDYHVLVIDVKIKIQVSDTIKYYANAMLTNANSAETTGEDAAIIVYK